MKSTTYLCWECANPIIKDRADFLLESGVDPRRLTCIKHANNTKIKGIYSGEVGTSPIIFCDKVYNDSVKTKFVEAEGDVEDTSDEVDL